MIVVRLKSGIRFSYLKSTDFIENIFRIQKERPTLCFEL